MLGDVEFVGDFADGAKGTGSLALPGAAARRGGLSPAGRGTIHQSSSS
jgi:hypothetical protein